MIYGGFLNPVQAINPKPVLRRNALNQQQVGDLAVSECPREITALLEAWAMAAGVPLRSSSWGGDLWGGEDSGRSRCRFRGLGFRLVSLPRLRAEFGVFRFQAFYVEKALGARLSGFRV